MAKRYKVTFKTYLNNRLKEVSFLGQQTYPLYVQVSHRGQTIFFKSYYFDLLAEAKYVPMPENVPKKKLLDDVAEMENRLLDFVVTRLGENFTMDAFKKDYAYFGQDIYSTAEQAFMVNMFAFFAGKELSALGWSFFLGGQREGLQKVLQGMRVGLKEELYNELMTYSVKTRVCFPLYEFIVSSRQPPYYFLSLMEWETGTTKEDFRAYIRMTRPETAESIIRAMEKFVTNYCKKRW